jgi:hypothetical protein
MTLFSFLFGTGSYFCYDNPGALQAEIKADMDITTADFANLYAWYSWPNVVLCFVGGYLLDRYAKIPNVTSFLDLNFDLTTT